MQINLDVGGTVPQPDKPVRVTVEGHGSLRFTEPFESIMGLAGQVVVMDTGKATIFSSSDFEFVSWDEKERVVTVKYNSPPPTPDR